MNKYFIILLFLISNSLFSQTSLDSLILVKINEYRISLKRKPLEWDSTIYKGAIHHSRYIYYDNLEEIEWSKDLDKMMPYVRSGHGEDRYNISIPNKSFVERAIEYGFIMECVYTVTGRMSFTEEYFATLTVEAWKNSPGHDKVLRTRNIRFAGVGTVVFYMDNVRNYNWQTIRVYKRRDQFFDETKSMIFLTSTFNCR